MTVEQLWTLNRIAETLGVPLFKIRRAAKAGQFPVYFIGNRRKLARFSEVLVAIERSRTGAVP